MYGGSVVSSQRKGVVFIITRYWWAIIYGLAQFSAGARAIVWENTVDLNEDFRLQWTVRGADITFEVQVATLGYVGLGFSETGAMDNADVAVGWVDNGQTYLQVSA